jgi:hypothetical protein
MRPKPHKGERPFKKPEVSLAPAKNEFLHTIFRLVEKRNKPLSELYNSVLALK